MKCAWDMCKSFSLKHDKCASLLVHVAHLAAFLFQQTYTKTLSMCLLILSPSEFGGLCLRHRRHSDCASVLNVNTPLHICFPASSSVLPHNDSYIWSKSFHCSSVVSEALSSAPAFCSPKQISSQNFPVFISIHHQLYKLPCPCWKETSQQHHTASTTFHCGDSVFRGM